MRKVIRTYTRTEFLNERKEYMDACKKDYMEMANVIFVDAGEDIICDGCNGDIEGDLLHVYDGELMFCRECREKELSEYN